jgi:hypothetical protein
MSSLFSLPCTASSRSNSAVCKYSQSKHSCDADAGSAGCDAMPVTRGNSNNPTHDTPSHQQRICNKQTPPSQIASRSDPYERLQQLYNRLDGRSASGQRLPSNLEPATLHFGNNTLTETITPISNSELGRAVSVEFGPSIPGLYHELSGVIAFEEQVFDNEEPSLVVRSMKGQMRKSFQTKGEVPTAAGTVQTTFVVGEITEDCQRLHHLKVHNNTAGARSMSRQVAGGSAVICPPYVKAATQDEHIEY